MTNVQLEIEAELGPEPIACWTAGRDLYLRRGEERQNIRWCAFEESKLSQMLDGTIDPRLGYSQGYVHGRLGRIWKTRRLWRIAALSGGEVVFLKHRFGLVRKDGEQIMARFDFKPPFKTVAEVLLSESSRIETLVSGLEVDPESDLHAAKTWLEKYRDGWSSMHFERGSHEELEVLVRALLQLWGEPRHNFFQQGQMFIIRNERLSVPLMSVAYQRDNEHKVKRLLGLLDEHFAARRQLRAYDVQGSSLKHEQLPTLRCEGPTMHQRLEALLLWRDFLRDKVAPAEIETLLPTR